MSGVLTVEDAVRERIALLISQAEAAKRHPADWLKHTKAVDAKTGRGVPLRVLRRLGVAARGADLLHARAVLDAAQGPPARGVLARDRLLHMEVPDRPRARGRLRSPRARRSPRSSSTEPGTCGRTAPSICASTPRSSSRTRDARPLASSGSSPTGASPRCSPCPLLHELGMARRRGSSSSMSSPATRTQRKAGRLSSLSSRTGGRSSSSPPPTGSATPSTTCGRTPTTGGSRRGSSGPTATPAETTHGSARCGRQLSEADMAEQYPLNAGRSLPGDGGLLAFDNRLPRPLRGEDPRPGVPGASSSPPRTGRRRPSPPLATDDPGLGPAREGSAVRASTSTPRPGAGRTTPAAHVIDLPTMNIACRAARQARPRPDRGAGALPRALVQHRPHRRRDGGRLRGADHHRPA